MLLPVLEASESWKNPCSSSQKMMRSSDSRLRCTISMAQACRNAATKSRSDDASMLLLTTRENPRRDASIAVSIA